MKQRQSTALRYKKKRKFELSISMDRQISDTKIFHRIYVPSRLAYAKVQEMKKIEIHYMSPALLHTAQLV